MTQQPTLSAQQIAERNLGRLTPSGKSAGRHRVPQGSLGAILRRLAAIDKPFEIYTELLERSALAQFAEALEQPYVESGALMADGHTGYSLPIGGVVACRGAVVPAYVGYDMGCGVCAVPTTFTVDDVLAAGQAIFDGIVRSVPVGFAHHRIEQDWDCSHLPLSAAAARLFAQKNARRQLGTLGGGNHFIEIGVDERGVAWVIIHSGSRGFGHAVASHYMALAANSPKPVEGHFPLAVDSEAGRDYIQDLAFTLAFALENRRRLLQAVVAEIAQRCEGGALWDEMINRNHNHAEQKDGLWIHRKGATHAEAGMTGVIPGDMSAGSYIVEGRGCEASLCSSSHGAGRAMGRKAAERTLSLEQFSDQMRGIIARVGRSTLSEAPGAYKDIHAVMAAQAELVTVRHHVQPLINIKSEDDVD